MRHEVPTIAFRGKIAQAMAKAYEERQAEGEHRGTMKCTHCGSSLSFAVAPDGRSRGHCSASCGIRWQT